MLPTVIFCYLLHFVNAAAESEVNDTATGGSCSLQSSFLTWCAAEWRKLSSVRKSSSACNVNDFVEVILLISNWNVQLPAHPHQDRIHWWQACSHLKGVKRVPFQGHVQVQRRWHMLQNLHFKQFVIAIGVTFSQADFNIMITSIVHWNLLFLHQRVESSSTALQFCNKRFLFFIFTTILVFRTTSYKHTLYRYAWYGHIHM